MSSLRRALRRSDDAGLVWSGLRHVEIAAGEEIVDRDARAVDAGQGHQADKVAAAGGTVRVHLHDRVALADEEAHEVVGVRRAIDIADQKIADVESVKYYWPYKQFELGRADRGGGNLLNSFR